MSNAQEKTVKINGSLCRVLEKGQGTPVVVLSGHGGIPRWNDFLEKLSQTRRVIAPSLPGQQGSERGHDLLHSPLDWLSAVLDLLDACEAPKGVDVIATSAAGMLVSEIAALANDRIGRLVLIGPHGLYDNAEPVVNIYGLAANKRDAALAENQEAFKAAYAVPADATPEEAEEFGMVAYRAQEAVARFMWPFGEIGLTRRLHRVTSPTLIIWGKEDKLIPPSYAKRFAEGLGGPSQVEILEGCGHLAHIDATDKVVGLINTFLK
jgi:abhydrolase domain-containing protein 6